jgi:hypothetical protein
MRATVTSSDFTEMLAMGPILLIVLIVLLIGGLPRYEYSRNWGYVPSGIVGLLLVVLLLLLIFNYLPWGFSPRVSP